MAAEDKAKDPPREGDVLPRGAGGARRIEDGAGDDRPGVTFVLNRPERSWWPLAAGLAVLAITAAITTVVVYPMWAAKDLAEQSGRATVAAVTQAVEKAAEALRPEVIRQETVTIIGEQAERAAKLVVLEQPVRVQVEKAEEYRLLWDYLYLGQNTATLRIDGNRVQWVVDLSRFSADDVVVDESAKRVTLRFPPVRLDREMVVVQTDPSRIRVETARGWARWPGSADQLVEEAKRELRPRVIQGADTPANRAAAQEAAEAALEKVVAPLTERWREEGYAVEVEVRSDERAQ